MRCIGIIWNVAFRYRREMVKIISNYAISISEQFEINLEERYRNFVRDIYMGENMEDWKIESKISHMENDLNRKVYIVFFEIDSKDKFYHPKKKKYVYSNLQELKDLLRNSYKEKIEDYFFDIIFHCTESDNEFFACKKAIEYYIYVC